MKTILIAVLSLISASAFADLGVSIYAAVGKGNTQQGDVYVEFDLVGFSGTVGNATFSNATLDISIPTFSTGGATRLNSIPYNVTSGSLFVTEAR